MFSPPPIHRFNVRKLLFDLELHLDLVSLRETGLTEEELYGYVDFYAENWLKAMVKEGVVLHAG